MIELIKNNNRTATLFLNNPPLNLVTLEMTQHFKTVLEEVENDEDIKVLIITARGKDFFCVGSDIKEFGHVRDRVVELKLDDENKTFLMIEQMSKPVIIAMNGMAIGGGCELALAGDLRILEKNSAIGLPEINLGVFPGSGGLYRLPKIIGISKAMKMMFTGERLTADEAYRIGLVDYLTEEGNALIFAEELADEIAKMPKDALRIIKHGVRKSLEMSLEQAIKYNLEESDFIFKTENCKEGVEAFFEKRQPQFE
ncbi:enoyl-CoA hydratase/isomerase family protein [Oceanobacillus sojae]|uniref:enoyl-CoA hydratase/isomerase family protein n=1 Tax=Oceanobacillus sojae TaxID=582851 RepID=UPI001C37C8AE|nr:enoyl-CoA hydratase/isomerase family protein [Oceanobacillus sojae]